MPKFSINLLVYNGLKFLPQCVESVLNQSYQDFNFLIIDNNSNDGSGGYIDKFKNQNLKIKIQVIFNNKNIGFATGHNQGIRLSNSDYVLCLNQDVILDKDFLKNAVEVLNSDDTMGSLQPQILRLKEIGGELQKTDIIDTTGLVIFKNRRVINRGQGREKILNSKFHIQNEIFGVDGAAPIYRRKALEDVKIPVTVRYPESIKQVQDKFISGSKEQQEIEILNQVQNDVFYEYFDEDFFMYKEDVDLAWRMRLYGWKAVYVPRVLAWHVRGAGDSAKTKYWNIIQERRKISQFSKFYSFKNQRLMQVKNELLPLFLWHFPWWFPKEIASWFYVLIFERYTAKAIKELIIQVFGAFKKRKVIMRNKKIGTKDMMRWFY